MRRVVPDGSAQVFVKLEYFNPTGSYKDRMAKSIIEEAERRGDLKPGMTVVEASGGSTGSSLAFICAVKGYHFIVASSNADGRDDAGPSVELEPARQNAPAPRQTRPSLYRRRSFLEHRAGSGKLHSQDKWNFCLTSA
ncbi:pyridoxal-phosphate dependent enzyme [Rhizobium johnstonii]|uniref:pyridoxal-phosphate dependent enzyme n=1 Tax=Rhizobium johnstonii TaxID=3019933 RepID=UPI003F9820A6